MIDEGQRGWKRELYDDDNEAEGYYFTFRFAGGPLYGMVEPDEAGGGWVATVNLEECDEAIIGPLPPATLGEAKAAALAGIAALLVEWRNKFRDAMKADLLQAAA